MDNTKGIFEDIDPEIMDLVASRRGALAQMGKLSAGLALATVPLGFAFLSKTAFAQGGLPQDIADVLNFALTLEFLESTFYTTGIAKSGLIPASDMAIFQQISKHETEHVAFLQSVLGSQAVSKPTFDFSAKGMFNPFADYATFQALAQAFEDTGVRAYKGQAANLMGNKVVLQAALQIHSVEARHASEVRRLRGQKGWITGNSRGDLPAATQAIYDGEDNTNQLGITVSNTEAFDEPLTKDQVLAIVQPFLA